MLEFLLLCAEAAEFRIQSGQPSMVGCRCSHLLVEFVDAVLRTLQLAFQARQLLPRSTGLGSRGDGRDSLITDCRLSA